MRFYYFDGRWKVPGTQDKHDLRVEVPTSSKELAEWLTLHNVKWKCDMTDAPAVADAPPPPCEAAASAAEPAVDVGMIEEFILDMATVAQVERLFAALGTRFAEMRPKLHG